MLGDWDTGVPLGQGTGGACEYGSRGLCRCGARECVLLQLRPLRTAVLSVPMVYGRGKGGIRLAQMLVRRSLFPQALPINGWCFYEYLCSHRLCRPHLRP